MSTPERDALPDQEAREAAKVAWTYLAQQGAAPDPESMLVDAPGVWEQHLDSLEEMLKVAGFDRLRSDRDAAIESHGQDIAVIFRRAFAARDALRARLDAAEVENGRLREWIDTVGRTCPSSTTIDTFLGKEASDGR